MTLDDLQRKLAASLAAGSEGGPEGYDAGAIERVRKSLESKRRRAVRHLLPRLRAALGDRWDDRFHEHARRYTPEGLLHHVDDAWEFAETIIRTREPDLWPAAHDDLVLLRLHYARDVRAGAERIRERRGFFVGWLRASPRRLVVRLPGGKILDVGW
ncbi:MAG TPA: hypothetical protein VE685_17690 [Thermoanaerobaculia bacterium]|nr:hypothetical protein [Thermoanaerobaculia bacterium]